MAFGDGEDEDIPVRSPVQVETAPIATTQDDEDFSTIKELLRIVEEAEGAAGDMNSLDKESKVPLESQMIGYQFALNELILPFKALCISTINDVKEKRRGTFNGQ